MVNTHWFCNENVLRMQNLIVPLGYKLAIVSLWDPMRQLYASTEMLRNPTVVQKADAESDEDSIGDLDEFTLQNLTAFFLCVA